MEKVENSKDKKFKEISDKWKELSYDYAIISAAIQYKKSKELITQKISNENVAITYAINAINKKVLENPEKYTDIENEFKEIMNKYENNLTELANYHDSTIVQGYTKVLEEENKQVKMYTKIYELIKEENDAKRKVDNSDDEIREEICNIEDEISKSELKVRRLKPTIRKKIEEKEKNISSAMETVQQEIQREVKGPKVFTKATKFFLGRIKPYKMIEKNVFSNVRNRIEKYEKEKKVTSKKINNKYIKKNIVATINEISKEDTEQNEA